MAKKTKKNGNVDDTLTVEGTVPADVAVPSPDTAKDTARALLAAFEGLKGEEAALMAKLAEVRRAQSDTLGQVRAITGPVLKWQGREQRIVEREGTHYFYHRDKKVAEIPSFD